MSLPQIESNEEVLLKSLLKFYREDDQHFLDLANIKNGKTIISLREMDFTVTKYGKKHKVKYTLPDGTLFNLPLDYKAQLNGHSKKAFDPFCRIGDKKDFTRLEHIFLDFETKTPVFLKGKSEEEIEEYKKRTDGIVTNVGQLNFFRWAIKNKIIEFCFQNKESIVEEMDAEYRIKKERQKQKKLQKEKASEKQTQKPTPKSAEKLHSIIVQFP